MNDFPYSLPSQEEAPIQNPYRKTPPTLNELLDAIERNQTVTIAALSEPHKWQLPHVMRLTSLVCTHPTHIPLLHSVLSLLWNDCQVYASCTYNNCELLTMLINTATVASQSEDAIHATKLLAVLWTRLEGISDYNFWMDESSVERILHSALNGLRRRPDEWSNTDLQSLCDYKTACASLVSSILKYDTEWLYSHPPSHDWSKKLLQESKRLTEASMPVSSYTLFSLTCLKLLTKLRTYESCSYLDHETAIAFDQFLESTEIQHFILLACFSKSTTSDGPRWTQQPSRQVTQLAFDVLQNLHRNAPSSLPHAIQKSVAAQTFVQTIVSKLLSSSSDSDHPVFDNNQHYNSITQLLFLLQNCRLWTRNTIVSCLTQQHDLVTACQFLCRNLLQQCQHNHSLSAIKLLHALLLDRLNPLRNDELCRAIWNNASNLQQHVLDLATELVSAHETLADYNRPRLLMVMDTLYICFRADPGFCQTTLARLTAETAERLVTIISTKHARFDLSQEIDFDSQESTPNKNNLSRVDQSMSYIEDDRPSVGMDAVVKLSTCTILALLGHADIVVVDNAAHVALLRERILDAANAFATDVNLGLSGNDGSLDMAQRRLRLVTCLATPENESNMAEQIHSLDMALRKTAHDVRVKYRRCSQSLQEWEAKVKRLVAEKDAITSRLSSQSIFFEREKNEIRREATMTSKGLVDVHVTERQKAEQELRQVARELERVSAMVESCRTAEASAKESLMKMTDQFHDASNRANDLATHVNEKDSELGRVMEELQKAQSQLQESTGKERDLRQKVIDQKQRIVDLTDSEGRVRDDLETLFGDMVLLAQMYEHIETQSSEYQSQSERQIQRLQKELDMERQRAARFEEQDKHLNNENDLLRTKYKRAKEKLEAERQARRNEAEQYRKRSGPVSYINQLHRPAEKGKENGSSSSQASSRRSRR